MKLFTCSKLGENHYLIELPVITYLFVQANFGILFILDFKPSFSNRAETELKCNTGIWENLALAFYHIQTGGTSPF